MVANERQQNQFITVRLVHPNGAQVSVVEVPANAKISKVINAFVRETNLGEAEQDGSAKNYRLAIKTGENEEELEGNVSLADAGVPDNATLRLYAKMRAG